MRTAAIGTALMVAASLYSSTAEAQVRTKCWAFAVNPSPVGAHIMIAGAGVTFQPSKLMPDPKRTPDSCMPRSEDSREFGDKRFGHIVVRMWKCQRDEPEFTGRLFLPGSKFAVALEFTKEQPTTSVELIFPDSDPYRAPNGQLVERLIFTCAIVR